MIIFDMLIASWRIFEFNAIHDEYVPVCFASVFCRCFLPSLRTRCHRSDILALSYLFQDGVPSQVPGLAERFEEVAVSKFWKSDISRSPPFFWTKKTWSPWLRCSMLHAFLMEVHWIFWGGNHVSSWKSYAQSVVSGDPLGPVLTMITFCYGHYVVTPY